MTGWSDCFGAVALRSRATAAAESAAAEKVGGVLRKTAFGHLPLLSAKVVSLTLRAASSAIPLGLQPPCPSAGG